MKISSVPLSPIGPLVVGKPDVATVTSATNPMATARRTNRLTMLEPMSKKTGLPTRVLPTQASRLLMNRPQSLTVLGVNKYFPALGLHRVNVHTQSTLGSKHVTHTHNGSSIQGSCSIPGLVPGIGLVSPCFSISKNESMHTELSDVQMHIADLTCATLDKLKVNDTILLQKQESINIGVYGSTSNAIDGIKTPALIANALVNGVLLPCALLAVGAGVGHEQEQQSSLTITKLELDHIGITGSMHQTHAEQKSAGIKTVCWLMWMASIVVDVKNFIAPPDSKTHTEKLKATPALWKNLAISFGINHSKTQSQQKTLHAKFDNKSSEDKHTIQSTLQDCHQSIDALARVNDGLVETLQSKSVSQKSQTSIDIQLLNVFQSTNGRYKQTVHTEVDAASTTSNTKLHIDTRENNHYQERIKMGQKVYKRTVSTLHTVETLKNQESKSLSLKQDTALRWSELKRESVHHLSQDFMADFAFIQNYQGSSSINGDIDTVINAQHNDQDLHFQSELNFILDFSALKNTLSQFAALKSTAPEQHQDLLQQAMQVFKMRADHTQKISHRSQPCPTLSSHGFFDSSPQFVKALAQNELQSWLHQLHQASQTSDVKFEQKCLELMKKDGGKSLAKTLVNLLTQPALNPDSAGVRLELTILPLLQATDTQAIES